MERSVIRGRCQCGPNPGLRCAPSGLRAHARRQPCFLQIAPQL